jgi:hypothetical protein
VPAPKTSTPRRATSTHITFARMLADHDRDQTSSPMTSRSHRCRPSCSRRTSSRPSR